MTLSIIPARFQVYLFTALRIVTGLALLERASMKLFHFPSFSTAATASSNVPTALLIFGYVELIGGALLLLGAFTRIAAFVVALELFAFYILISAKLSLYPAINGGEFALLVGFIALYFSSTGAGPHSIDSLFARRK